MREKKTKKTKKKERLLRGGSGVYVLLMLQESISQSVIRQTLIYCQLEIQRYV